MVNTTTPGKQDHHDYDQAERRVAPVSKVHEEEINFVSFSIQEDAPFSNSRKLAACKV